MVAPTRRRKPAAASRIVASGLSTSAFFGVVGLIAHHDQAAQASDGATGTTAPAPTVDPSTSAGPTEAPLTQAPVTVAPPPTAAPAPPVTEAPAPAAPSCSGSDC